MTAAAATDVVADDNARLLAETPLLDYSHPALRALIAARGWRDLPDAARMAAIYAFVKDEIRFGYNSDDDIPASAVLADGYGQCNTKATLFMALLRGCGIPCRFHGFTIDKALQKGAVTGIFYLLAPRDILHSWVEIPLQGRWLKLEGLILDGDYLRGLQARFPECRGSFCGYGAATPDLCNPPVDWSGGDTFIQADGINRDFGLFDTPDAFYARVGTNIRGWKRWLYIRLVRHLMNRNVARIRGTAS